MHGRNIGNGKGIGVSAEPETCTTASRLAERTRQCRAPFELHRGSAPRRGRARGEGRRRRQGKDHRRSEEHTSELQSPMRISYAGFCLKKQHHYYYTSTPRHTHYTYAHVFYM